MKKGLKKLIAVASAISMLGATAGGLAACNKDKGDGGPTTTVKEDVYTYNATYSLSPSTWSPHTWETNDDSVILGYTTMGLYDVQLNADADGYEWVCEMASAFPVDVTSDYVGKYGISAGDTRKVWEIALNENAYWDDGTKITADDYIYSMKELLNPDMLNRRADSYTGGGFVLYGAKDYLYSHTTETYETIASQGYATVSAALTAHADVYIDVWSWWGMQGGEKVVDGDVTDDVCPQWLSVTDETNIYLDPAYYDDLAEGKCTEADIGDYYVTGKDVFDYTWANYASYFEVGADYNQYLSIKVANTNLDDNFDHVGIEKKDDYTIVMAGTDELDDFYSKYYFSSNWLVKKDVYEACKVSTSGLISSTYCTSKETTPSYGPYVLSKYTRDVEFQLTYNPNWYGYSDNKHEGQFQTTSLNYRFLASSSAHATTKELFFEGKVDGLDFETDDEYQTYGSSKHYNIYPESYTMQLFMTTNTQYLEQESSATENHRPLQLASFRKAISNSINRQAYCAAYYPASQPGFGILNYLYAIDGVTGELYRDQEAAKRTSLAYAQFTEDTSTGKWTSFGGTEFDTLDDAYEAITGYDPAYAAELFQQAYTEAKQQGLYTDGEDVVIEMVSAGQSASAMFSGTVNMFNQNIAAALALCPAGTTFKSVTIKVGTSASQEEYKARQKAGEMDISYSGWGGATFNPWGVIFSSYIDPANSNNWGFDALSKTINIDIQVEGGTKNGQTVTASLYDWAAWLDNHQANSDYDTKNLYTELGMAVGNATTEFKVKVLAACELAQLNTTLNIPLYYQSIGSLDSAKVSNGADQYLPIIGFGGIRHVKYNYTNSEWTAWVSAQGGNLENYYKTN
ncbi:MAG: ABC transporter substrate-binding protein [Roseburia sp.]|nr:ABC transporter substrate-binding protein [Roseburia sp.]